MKKYLLIVISILLLLTLFAGCGKTEKSAPLVTVTADGEETVLPEYWFCSKRWSKGWMFADGPHLSEMLDEVCEELPEVTYSEDISLRFGENVELDEINIYDSSFEKFVSLDDPAIFSRLGSGVYYAEVVVFEYQKRERKGERGYSGYACGFKLKIPGPVTVLAEGEEVYPVDICYDANYRDEDGNWFGESSSWIEADARWNAPEVFCAEDITLKLAENVHIDSIGLVDAKNGEAFNISKPEELRNYSDKNYYVELRVTQYGEEHDGKREYWNYFCTFKMVSENGPLVTIYTEDGKEIYPIEMDYDRENNWLDITGENTHDEIYQLIPEAVCGRNFSVRFAKNAQLDSIFMRKEDLDHIFSLGEPEFGHLDEGIYYADLVVERQGKKYSCAFRLANTEKENAPVVYAEDGVIAEVTADGEKLPVYTELCRDETGYCYVPFYQRLGEVQDRIPVIEWQEGMELVVSDGYECWGISAYDTAGEFIEGHLGTGDFSELARLNGGRYYFDAYIVEKHSDESAKFNAYNCVFRMMIGDLDPLVTVISNGKETAAPKYWYCGTSWEEGEDGSGGWLCADGMGIYDDLEGYCAKLPEVRMGEDFSIKYGKGVTPKSSFEVYDENFREAAWTTNPEDLKMLESGSYYVIMSVFRNGTEVHEGETGYDGYHCGFKLTVS